MCAGTEFGWGSKPRLKSALHAKKFASPEPPSKGELSAMAARLGWLALIDREGARFQDRGLARALLTDPDIERLLLADGELLRTPIVRRGKEIFAGARQEGWKSLL